MSDQDNIIAQIYAYPYRRADDGSRGFQKHHQGLSKLVLQKIENDLTGASVMYKVIAIRKEDQEVVSTFQLSGDFRVRYATTEHFVMFLDKSTTQIYGFGTCKDESSVQKTEKFVKTIEAVVRELQANKLEMQREQSRAQSSLQATSSSITNKQNIDALTALMPMTVLESAENHDGDDLNTSSSTILSSVHSSVHSIPVSPRLTAQPSSSSLNAPSGPKTHLPIIMSATPAPVASAELADKILSANLRRHRNSIAIDPTSIPPTLVFSEKPEPQQTGKDAQYDATVAKLGTLETFPQRKEVSEHAEQYADPNVSKPFKVQHSTHVSFGRDGFKGIPTEWIKELQRQFGVPLEQLPGSMVSGYTGKIPFVFQVLRDLLIDKGGLESVGIFRLAPQADHSDQAKMDIDNGLLLSKAAKRDQNGKLIFDYEVHVISNLIKVWLRDLPTALLHHIHRGKVEGCKTSDEAWNIVGLLPDPYLSLCQYLIDFLSVVSSHHDINKMPPTNIAICFCPNLCKVNDADPMASLVFTQKVSKWLTLAIQHRMDHPRDDIEEQVDQLTMLYSTESAELLPGIEVPTPRHHLGKDNPKDFGKKNSNNNSQEGSEGNNNDDSKEDINKN